MAQRSCRRARRKHGHGADPEPLCQLRLQTAGIQNGTGADDLILGQSGDLVKHIGQHIHRIGNDHIDRFGRIGKNIFRHILQDVHIGLGKIQSGHTGLSCNAAGDDNNIRISSLVVITGSHNGW